MSWFLAAVLLSQIVVFYGIGAPAAMRQLYLGFFARNPEWASQDDRMVALQLAQKRAIGIVRLAGLAWLSYCMWWLFVGADGSELIRLVLTSMLCWLILDVVIDAVERWRIGRTIPLPSRRSATFAPRTVGAFIHRAWIVVGLIAAAAIFGAYLMARQAGMIDDDLLFARLPVVALGFGAWCAALWYAVHRKKQAIDDAIGSEYRRFDVHATVITLYVFAAAAGFFAVRDLIGVYLLPDTVFVAVVSLIVQGFVLVAVRRYRSSPLSHPRFQFNPKGETK